MAPEGPAPWDLPKGPLFVYNGGLMRRPLRQMLAQAGWPLRLGLPRQGDLVGLWGASPTAWRAETIAARRAARLIRFEDAFLRSLHPGRGGGGAPLGLIPDHLGVHFDPARPSRLERILAEAPLDDGDLLRRAHDGMARLAALDLSKYNAHDPDLPPPPPGYVLVIDQLRGDASVRLAGVRAHIFREMLVFAQEEHPGARVLIKTHPETISGQRPGHYGPEDAQGRVSLLAAPHSPRALLEGRSRSIRSARRWGSRRSSPATARASSASPSMPAGA
ncbi:capsular polysaccharide biosynthesis protein [Phaeovulum vinaykumarii]|uniref:Capsular polysaccharide export protein n=1 Tax=Phaeovulum vinaykumarii TaxID=407234 RepID=A0A1N7LW31_9RHOB|nr:capsular polysaccharide export protein [Phaeovulum vinaykumarii]SOC07250.1 capsular polysaccharide biosynthesis protein [Phaeovulum vinaykumarii]